MGGQLLDRLIDYLMYPSHTLLHALLGGYIFLLLIKTNDNYRNGNFYIIFLIGCFLGLFPDILKFFGDITAHSIFFTPIYGVILALIINIYLRINQLKTWFYVTITLIISHILIDYLENGVALFYPFIKKEYSFYIISHEGVFVTLLLVGIGLYVIFNKKIFIIMPLIILVIYLFLIGMSKLYLDDRLQKQFSKEEPYLIISYPTHHFNEWGFMVRTDETFYSGISPYFPINIEIINTRIINE